MSASYGAKIDELSAQDLCYETDMCVGKVCGKMLGLNLPVLLKKNSQSG